MRKHLALASAILALFIAACGSSSSPAATATTPSPKCTGAGTQHAYVVVEHLSGASLQRCVAFTDSIGGKQLMDQSGINYQSQTFSFGLAICAIDNEPATFTQCFEQGKPYWSLFVEQSGTWTAAQTGIDQMTLHDKDALGWRFVPAADATPSPPPLANES